MMVINYADYVLPLFACSVLSGLFVGSLYVWDSKYNRNHPSGIKQRFCSVFVVMLISPFILKLFINSDQFKKFTVLELVGLRMPGFFPAAVIPLFLTMVLFLGPLYMLDHFVLFHSFLDYNFWVENITNLIWVRNVIVGPFSEEFTFRACMMPLLLQCYTPITAILVCSLFFGLAHVHHVIERYKLGEPLNILLIRALIQFSYTTVFGAYSAFIFVRTGHFVAPFVVHSFCNVMEFPDFGKIFTYKNPKRSILIFLFISGAVLWYILLEPLMNHERYQNNIYFNV